MDFEIDHSWMIPIADDQAVSRGWPHTDGRPVAVTWHWTATADLAECNELLGGADAARKRQASAHVAIGRSFAEGVARYVDWQNRSWHAGRNQVLRWDGRPKVSEDEKGARTSVGIETVNVGYARPGFPAADDWARAATVDGKKSLRIAPWTEEQIEMMIALGREVVDLYPDIGPRDHHGHHDLCPGYKDDVLTFPFARVLRGIYDDPSLPDVWSHVWTVRGRRRALERLGYRTPPAVDDDAWTVHDDLALRRFQADHGHQPDGLWTSAVCWLVHDTDRRARRLQPNPRLSA